MTLNSVLSSSRVFFFGVQFQGRERRDEDKLAEALSAIVKMWFYCTERQLRH